MILLLYIWYHNKLSKEYQKQAEIYTKIVTILRKKIKSGVVTLNFWDMAARTRKGKEGTFHSIYDSDFKPTPAYKTINLSKQKLWKKLISHN